MKPRIVVDTNVFVGALLSTGGQNRNVVRACLRGDVTPVIGDTLFTEFTDVMGRQKLFRNCPLNAQQRTELFEAFLSTCDWCKIYFLWRPNLPDEGDNHLVELALAGNAGAIVTNNIRDFQRGELDFPDLKIQRPQEFLTSISWQP